MTDVPPDEAMSFAEIEARRFPLFTKLVGRELPFQETTELLMKLVPKTSRVNAAPPAVAVLGLKELIEGIGLLVTSPPPELPPPQLT